MASLSHTLDEILNLTSVKCETSDVAQTYSHEFSMNVFQLVKKHGAK